MRLHFSFSQILSECFISPLNLSEKITLEVLTAGVDMSNTDDVCVVLTAVEAVLPSLHAKPTQQLSTESPLEARRANAIRTLSKRHRAFSR